MLGKKQKKSRAKRKSQFLLKNLKTLKFVAKLEVQAQQQKVYKFEVSAKSIRDLFITTYLEFLT